MKAMSILVRNALNFLVVASTRIVAGSMFGNAAAIYHWMSKDEEHPEGALLGSILRSLFTTYLQQARRTIHG